MSFLNNYLQGLSVSQVILFITELKGTSKKYLPIGIRSNEIKERLVLYFIMNYGH
jgi:hypothetical protein